MIFDLIVDLVEGSSQSSERILLSTGDLEDATPNRSFNGLNNGRFVSRETYQRLQRIKSVRVDL